jgi:hypothetical protein
MPFDPTEDYAPEPVVPLNLRMRVVESPLRFNSSTGSDGAAAPLLLDGDRNGLHDGLEVLWETNRMAPAPVPDDAAVNIRHGVAAQVPGPLLARHFRWATQAPLTNDNAPRTVNGSPEAYVDVRAGTKWACGTGPTDIGAASCSTRPQGRPGGAFGETSSSSTRTWTRHRFAASVDPNETAARHWSFWNSGKRGRWEVHYPHLRPPTPIRFRTSSCR